MEAQEATIISEAARERRSKENGTRSTESFLEYLLLKIRYSADLGMRSVRVMNIDNSNYLEAIEKLKPLGYDIKTDCGDMWITWLNEGQEFYKWSETYS